jgi:hypothetical protein
LRGEKRVAERAAGRKVAKKKPEKKEKDEGENFFLYKGGSKGPERPRP